MRREDDHVIPSIGIVTSVISDLRLDHIVDHGKVVDHRHIKLRCVENKESEKKKKGSSAPRHVDRRESPFSSIRKVAAILTPDTTSTPTPNMASR